MELIHKYEVSPSSYARELRKLERAERIEQRRRERQWNKSLRFGGDYEHEVDYAMLGLDDLGSLEERERYY